MKEFLLGLSLFSFSLIANAYEQVEDGPMTNAQADELRFNAVTLAITDVNDRVFSKKAIAKYEALLSNPYTRGIVCDIELASVHENIVIDSKTHYGVYAPARSAHKIKGEIEIRRGRKDNDGLDWIFAKGELVAARNCKFIH